jgi:hypothetical protein
MNQQAAIKSFEDTAMERIIAIVLVATVIANVLFRVPWVPSLSEGGAPLAFMFAMGTGLPVLFVSAAHANASLFPSHTLPSSRRTEHVHELVRNSGPVLATGVSTSPAGDGSLGVQRAVVDECAVATVDQVLGEIATHPLLAVLGRLEASGDDDERVNILEARMRQNFTPDMAHALGIWAGYHKGLRLLLQQVCSFPGRACTMTSRDCTSQFSRARPGKQGPSDVEEVRSTSFSFYFSGV